MVDFKRNTPIIVVLMVNNKEILLDVFIVIFVAVVGMVSVAERTGVEVILVLACI